jgi:hypothetical protein
VEKAGEGQGLPWLRTPRDEAPGDNRVPLADAFVDNEKERRRRRGDDGVRLVTGWPRTRGLGATPATQRRLDDVITRAENLIARTAPDAKPANRG